MYKMYIACLIALCFIGGYGQSYEYPTGGVVIFSTSTDSSCSVLAGNKYRHRDYFSMAPQVDTCYKCGGKAIKYEKLQMAGAGKNVRQCVNLNNDCNGAFSCTDINPGACVNHPCMEGSSIYGTWKIWTYRGYLVQPYVDNACANTDSLPMPIFYYDVSPWCVVGDNTTDIAPNNPKCTKWTTNDNGNEVELCRAPEVTCTQTSSAYSLTECKAENGATCNIIDTTGMYDDGYCTDGAYWPFLGYPGSKAKFIDGIPLFSRSSTLVSSMLTLFAVLIMAILM